MRVATPIIALRKCDERSGHLEYVYAPLCSDEKTIVFGSVNKLREGLVCRSLCAKVATDSLGNGRLTKIHLEDVGMIFEGDAT
jgi:hypothetical protein